MCSFDAPIWKTITDSVWSAYCPAKQPSITDAFCPAFGNSFYPAVGNAIDAAFFFTYKSTFDAA